MTYELIQCLALVMAIVTWYPVGIVMRGSDDRV